VTDSRFTRPTDGQINATLTEATRRVSAAVNRTRVGLRGARTAEDLLRFVRYPPSHALNLARSAEIFEQTMEALLADVNAGHTYNISGTGKCSASKTCTETVLVRANKDTHTFTQTGLITLSMRGMDKYKFHAMFEKVDNPGCTAERVRVNG